MPRRRVVAKREILPDPKFGDVTLAKFMNHVMISGKKSVAERIVYGALDIVKEKALATDIQPQGSIKQPRVLTHLKFENRPRALRPRNL